MVYFLVAGFITGLAALWLSGLFRTRYSPKVRWIAFTVIWMVGMVLSYIPAR